MNSLLGSLRWRRGIPAPKHAPKSRSAVRLPGVDNGLRFSEWILIGLLCLAYLLSISQPLFGIQLHRTILNHFPLILLLPALVFHLLSIAFNPRPAARVDIVSICWPLTVLAVYALLGSLAARFLFKVSDSYLSFGFYLILLPVWAAVAPTRPERVASWVRALVTIWLLFALMALAGEVVRANSRETLHEIEYLVLSGFFVALCVARSMGVKLAMLLLMLAAAALNQKLTGYIVAAMAVLHLLVISGRRTNWKPGYTALAILISITVAGVLAILYFAFRDYLPSGNPDVRLKQYEAAWRTFLDSPVWGQAYLKGSGEDYIESARRLSLPTHSDVLDILKHGGAIGLLLFTLGYWKIFALLNRAIAATRSDRLLNGYFVGVRFFQVSALVTFAINPLLLKGPFLIVIWGNLGLATGLALTVMRRPPALPRT